MAFVIPDTLFLCPRCPFVLVVNREPKPSWALLNRKGWKLVVHIALQPADSRVSCEHLGDLSSMQDDIQ